MRNALMASGAVAALLALSTPADAGGFAVREQSTEFQGMSFAGAGAGGGGLSAMFWNPAVAAYAPVGIYSESHYAAIIGRSEITGDLFTHPGGVNLGLPQKSGDIAKDAIVPASYLSFRLSEKLVAAISVNSPFGLVTEPSNRFYAGQTFARTSEIKTYNFAPTLAYRLTPAIAVGVGIQIQHIEGRLKEASTTFAVPSNNITVQGDDTAFGFTAGINLRPSDHTHIGLGYRSSIDHTLEGTIGLAGVPGARIKAGATLPETVTLSARHEITDKLTLLGTVEWTHWNRLQKLDVVCAQATPGVLCPAGNGGIISSLPLGWHDGWFFSVGGEYEYSEKLTLRSGVAYEISPVQSAEERPHRVPDANRIWASVGATYKWSDKMAFDFAYSHIFVEDAPIDRLDAVGAINPNVRFIGHADTSVDIFAASLKIKFGGPEHHESMK